MTVVHYEANRSGDPALRSLPWVEAAPASGIIGHLFYYDAVSAWSRARLPGFRIYTGGRAPDGRVNMKILWELQRSAGTGLKLTGNRLDGAGSFTQRYRGASPWPSIIRVPSRGCWRLTLKVDNRFGHLTVLAVSRRR